MLRKKRILLWNKMKSRASPSGVRYRSLVFAQCVLWQFSKLLSCRASSVQLGLLSWISLINQAVSPAPERRICEQTKLPSNESDPSRPEWSPHWLAAVLQVFYYVPGDARAGWSNCIKLWTNRLCVHVHPVSGHCFCWPQAQPFAWPQLGLLSSFPDSSLGSDDISSGVMAASWDTSSESHQSYIGSYQPR